MSGCNNPFAPSLDKSESTGSAIGDLTKIEGVFQNLQYAYTFRDTSIYGRMLSDNFLFSYRDYDLSFDISWGREEEMKVTHGLFQNAERLDLIWNNIIASTEDSSEANIVRGFNLTITFNPTDIVRVDGRVNLNLKKESTSGKWKLTRWIDESNF
ncbi:MAG: hypothetical protein COZ80_01720 [Ignavibacteria bacterium CG_4_8_14_3_um_filter_37_9]|nr:hypothetical protein [Ignavibacteria bacterium]OIO13912.1 MAG: hypothetical protein AUJ54_15405 [Ignavibacteria bacterium CG1_02_37_35]PIP79781.1 MAG: hypothetical protein COW85_00145 [Ignavibacteria bacterium CG22_combo_CG10-13_8_21_14_all_37_15]PIS45472.1 MAG: hypothetical protein COT22_05125 [Ignavibacteria bacterium CG08_land_8_20_14_0_20_37_9]PIX00143.1 MAG: hypothetical protein COZ80_01720 [Ignavibacteria bacterium CG_4_8_14_3_um_filter_37_9]PIX94519.1 MAG: hypothetical protein COZ25_